MTLRAKFFKEVSFLLLLLCGCYLPLSGQSAGWITGRVYDAQTSEPLPGATIIFGKDRGSVSDLQGYFQFEAPAGTINLTIQYVGYKPLFLQVALQPADTLFVDAGLDVFVAEIEQVVVSAGKLEQRLSDLTVSMSLIRPEAIGSYHITSTPALLNKTAGVEVLDGQVSIRGGSGFSYGAGSRVMVLVDGLPMLSADAGSVRWQSLPLENLAQIEIIKGASSVLYGSSALNGIIHFRSAEATPAGNTSFYAETGIYGNPRTTAWKWYSSPRLFYSANFSHLKRYGNTDLSLSGFFLDDPGYRKRNDNLMGRVNLRVKHRCTQVDGLIYGMAVNAMQNKKYDFILWENASTGALIQDISTAQLLNGRSIAIDPFINLHRNGRFTHALRSRIQFSFNEFPDGGQNDSDTRSVYSEYQLGVKASEALGLNAGVMHHSSRVRSVFYGDHDAYNTALFAQADITPADRLKMVAGFRLEHLVMNAVDEGLVPLFRTGINYRLFDLTFLRASYGQGYRYPSVAERYAATTLGAVRIFPNPMVEAESGWNAEIGIKQGWINNSLDGLFDFSLFYLQNKDLIEFVFGHHYDPILDDYGLGFKATNIEYSRVYGFEWEYLLNIRFRNLQHTIGGGYVYMFPVEFNPVTLKNTGNHLKFRRKHSFAANLSSQYRQFEWGVHARANSRILNIDDVFLNPATREGILPGFYDYWQKNNRGFLVVDISFGIKIGDLYRLTVAVKNLTNVEYMGRPGDIQPQRHMSLRLSGSL